MLNKKKLFTTNKLTKKKKIGNFLGKIVFFVVFSIQKSGRGIVFEMYYLYI